MNCKILNQALIIQQEAGNQFRAICEEVNQKLVGLDRYHLLMPGEISVDRWTMQLEFSPDFKEQLANSFSPYKRVNAKKIDHMTREELQDYIFDNNLGVELEEYINEPLESLIKKVKSIIGLNKNGISKDWLDCDFEHIGLYAWKNKESLQAEITIYVSMIYDVYIWSFINRIANSIGGDIYLHSNDWEFNEIKCRSFNVVDRINPVHMMRYK